MTNLKNRLVDYYEKNEAKVDVAFFLGGFLFDVVTLSDIDDPFSILQQIVYLFVTGTILYYEFLVPLNLAEISPRLSKIWNYRQLIFHFLMGSLLSVYSLFFLKSSSFFSSMIFVILLMALMVANELKTVQKSRLNIKIALYIICIFSFFSMIIPVILGFVGIVPFTLAFLFTLAYIYFAYRLLLKKIVDKRTLIRQLVSPGIAVTSLFLLFYLIGWVPPVPLSVQNMGIYHQIEKSSGQFILHHERPWWRFWHNGDQDFEAQPGDKIYFFAKIFCPGRFNDSVVLHWYYKDPRWGWKSTDRIPMQVTGGRRTGYRGFATKQNYSPGEWRVSVETTDQREIGRLYFEVKTANSVVERQFEKEVSE